jgi:hypothetical protein
MLLYLESSIDLIYSYRISERATSFNAFPASDHHSTSSSSFVFIITIRHRHRH